MHEKMRILQSKLMAPHAPDTIRRERLLSSMDQSGRKKLTTIVAGAGYGKTTLAAQAVSSWNIKTVWYRLDDSDRDLVTFICYLIAGIRMHHDEFGDATLQYLKEIHDAGSNLQSLLTTLLSEMENTIRTDFIIVLDDYHSVIESTEINEALDILLRDLSPLTHLILVSRSEPTTPLSRLRAMREVIDIREDDLAFTAAEIGRLCSDVFDFSLEAAGIDAAFRTTGGWASGLILLCHSLRGRPSEEIEKNLLNLKGSRKAIFSYLEENIYAALPSERQDFLIKTSIFPRINADFCDRLLNIGNSLEVLRHLEKNHLFTSSVDEEWYSYHQLFRDFLQSRLKDQLDHELIVKLHRDAAILLEASGEEDEAVRHYLAAEEFERACDLLKPVGKRLFTEGRFQLISQYLEAIPSSILDEQPWMQHLQAQLTGLRGRRREAIDKYDKALSRFRERKDEEGIQSCLVESGLIDFQTGNLHRAQERLQALIARENLDPKLNIEVLGYLIYISSYLWNMSFADRCFEEAMALLENMDDEDLRHKCLVWIYVYRGFRYLFSGDYEKVLEICEYVKAISRNSEPHHSPVVHYLLASTACYNLQLYSRGFETAGEALSIIKKRFPQPGMTASGWHSPRSSPLGLRERAFPDPFPSWLLATSALNAVELGKMAEALTEAEESLKLFRRMGFRHGEAFAYYVLSKAHMKSGAWAEAEQCTRLGIETVRGLTWLRTELNLRMCLAECLIEKGELEEASQALKETEERVGDIVNITHFAKANLLYARIYWLSGRCADSLHRLLAALEFCEQKRFGTLIVAEKRWIIPPLVEAFAQGKMQEYILKVAAGIGPEAATQLSLAQDGENAVLRETASSSCKALTITSSPSLRINMLGKFKVIKDGKEIPAASWRSRKARTLFQFLVHSRPRGYVNKEVLMELLWPEEDPKLTAKRFHVALASLRKTLEPEINRGDRSSFLSRLNDSYRVDLGNEGWVDIEELMKELRRARAESDTEKAIAHLLKAESLYGGDFLEEEPYSEWGAQAREKYREGYLYALKGIFHHFGSRGSYMQGIEYAEKYLEVDKYAEDVYRSLMAYYWKTGDRFRMARTFKRCGENIKRDLDCEPSEETKQLYRELASSQRN
jgi:ATP/maltotriose-dependent transcriptional regulator MalT/DNA-binding SARP family transcriptional activator